MTVSRAETQQIESDDEIVAPDNNVKPKRRGRKSTTDDQVRGPRPTLFAPARRPGRRVTRILRHVQLWSVFKVALLGGLVLYGIFLISIVVVWSMVNAAGQVENFETFMRDIGFENWTLDGAQLFRAAAIIGAVGLAVSSVLLTLWAAVINLIAELTGGLRFTVIEPEDDDEDHDDE